jgi:hypothetical protein
MQLRGERARIAEPVLLVENEIIESGEAQDLDDLRMAEHRPAAENLLAIDEALLQRVFPIHGSSRSQWKGLSHHPCPWMRRQVPPGLSGRASVDTLDQGG